MDNIKKWLSGNKNFTIGRAIYLALISSTDILSKKLAAGETTTNKRLLAEAFLEHVTPTIAAAKVENNAPVVDPQRMMMEVSDPVLTAFRNEWLLPYKKMSFKQMQLDKFGESNEPDTIFARKTLAFEVLSLEQQCIKIWAARDHYEQTGELPTDKKVNKKLPTDPVKIAQIIVKLKRNIRTNRLSMQRYPDKIIFAEKYLNYKAEFKRVTSTDYQDL